MGSAALSEPWHAARRVPREAVAAGAWFALIAACWAVGTAMNAAGSDMLLHAPPLFGGWDLQLGLDVLVPTAVAAAVALAGPVVARTVSWPWMLAACGFAFLAWTVALALTNGADGLTHPLETKPEYLRIIPGLGSPGDFLSMYFDRVDAYPTHVRGHPPGMVLILLGLQAAGLGGSAAASALILAFAATTPVAALIALRAVAGEDPARRAAPYLVLLPAAVYVAISADALYMGIGAWAVAAVVVAIARADGPATDILALVGGLIFGVVAFLSYGLVLLGAIPLAVAVARRRLRPLLLAGAGFAVVLAAFAAAGFWWFDGLAEVRAQYAGSIARNRPYEFFVFNNLAVLALVTGPAVAIALARLRDPRIWLLVGGGIGAIALADLSGMSKGEVERIWLAFVPWVVVATCALPVAPRATRALLGAQAATAIAIEVGVSTLW